MSQPPPIHYVEELVEKAVEKLQKTPKLIVLEPQWPMTIIGDIHGDYNTFKKIVESSGFNESLRKGIVVFLGDYVDRGPHQLEVIVEVLELLISRENVYTLRGNHEPPPHLPPYPHDFPELLETVYGAKGRELYARFRRLFDELPYAVIAKGFALMLHGGPPIWVAEERYTSLIEALKPGKHGMDELLEQVLWNDPHDSIELWAPSPRGAGVLWGWRVTEAALRKGGLKYIIRGHEAVETGFKLNHGGSVVTVFSRLGPPYYNRAAAYLHITRDCNTITSCVEVITS